MFSFTVNIASPISSLIDKLIVEEDKANAGSEMLQSEKIDKLERGENKNTKNDRFDKNLQYRLISSNVKSFYTIYK